MHPGFQELRTGDGVPEYRCYFRHERVTYDTAETPQQGVQDSAGTPKPSGGSSAGSGTAVPKMRVGAKVQYSGPLYRDSNGNGQGKTVNGTFTVKYYYPGHKCGVHVDGLGWVPESACSVVG